MIEHDGQLIELITGYQPAAAITTAQRLGIFETLGEVPADPDDLARELSVDGSNLAALLEALCSFGLVERSSRGYAATAYTARRLGRGGDMALVVAKEGVFAEAWMNLGRVIRSGRPTMDSWKTMLGNRPEQALAFLKALDVLARIGGPPLEDADVLAPGRRVLDVGGGLGTYSRLLQGAGSEVTLVDLPQVGEWASERLAGTGVSIIGVDLFDHPSCGIRPNTMDAALVSHLLHDLAPERCVDLLLRVRNALVPGGVVVVNDFASDRGPGAFGPLFDLMMRVETGGAAHSRAALEAMLSEAGFGDTELLPYGEPLTVYVARKP